MSLVTWRLTTNPSSTASTIYSTSSWSELTCVTFYEGSVIPNRYLHWASQPVPLESCQSGPIAPQFSAQAPQPHQETIKLTITMAKTLTIAITNTWSDTSAVSLLGSSDKGKLGNRIDHEGSNIIFLLTIIPSVMSSCMPFVEDRACLEPEACSSNHELVAGCYNTPQLKNGSKLNKTLFSLLGQPASLYEALSLKLRTTKTLCSWYQKKIKSFTCREQFWKQDQDAKL